MEEGTSLEEFILNVEIPTFKRFLDSASRAERDLVTKLILIIAQADISLKNFQLQNNDLPIVSYLSHNGKIEINYTNSQLEKWFGKNEFYFDLKDFNLPIIEGTHSSNKIHITLTKSPVLWEKLANLCNAFEIYKIPSEPFIIEGFLSSTAVESICVINPFNITSEICFLPPCKKPHEFHNKCNLYGLDLLKNQ